MEKRNEELFENTKRDMTQVEDSLIPEAEREALENGTIITGKGDANLSPDAGKPML